MVYSWGYSWQSVKAAGAAAKRAAQQTPRIEIVPDMGIVMTAKAETHCLKHRRWVISRSNKKGTVASPFLFATEMNPV
jgi:hypothetical protein